MKKEKVIRKIVLIGAHDSAPLDDTERFFCEKHGVLGAEVFQIGNSGPRATCYLLHNGYLYQCWHDDSNLEKED